MSLFLKRFADVERDAELLEIDPREVGACVKPFAHVERELAAETEPGMPFVAHEVAEVFARLAAFEEDVAGEPPEQRFAEFGLQEQRLVPVEVVRLDAAEPLDAIGPGEHIEGNVPVHALPQESDRHGGVPYEFAEAAHVEFLRSEGVVAQRIGVELVFPLDQVTVPGPVEVIARVVGEVVANPATPSVDFAGVFHGTVVIVEIEFAVVDAVGDAVLEGGPFLRQQEVRFYQSFGIEGRTRQRTVHVLVRVVAEPVEVGAPVFVEEVDLARDAVVHQEKQRRDGGRDLVFGGGVGDDVEFAGTPALERGLEKEVAHQAVFELRLFRVAEYRDDGVSLEIVLLGFLCGNRSQERCAHGYGGEGFSGEFRHEQQCRKKLPVGE